MTKKAPNYNHKEWVQWSKSEQCKEVHKNTSEANEHHQQVMKALRTSISSARRAGEALIEAKKRVPHGLWGKWVYEFFCGSHETANVYMRICSNWSRINRQLNYGVYGGDKAFTISQAVAILREERPKPQVSSAWDNGHQVNDQEPDWDARRDNFRKERKEFAIGELTRIFEEMLWGLEIEVLEDWGNGHAEGLAEFVAGKQVELSHQLAGQHADSVLVAS